MNIFREVKEQVTARQVAERYGLKARQNGMACCPFHNDKHPSMKIDQNYYCFACGAKGDAVNYVAVRFGLSQFEAAKKINEDFALGIPIGKEEVRKKREPEVRKKEKVPTMEKNYGLTSDRVIAKAIDIVANENSFHPILQYLESLKWDGIPRIQHMLTHFFGAEDIAYTGEVLKMHMMGAIRRLYEPGAKYDIMLCLVGGQGTGKSTFFRYLAIKDEWFTDDMKRIDDKKVYEYLQGHWIVEMSEMNAVANAKSIEETKSFLSRQKDIYRIPYERRAEDRYRQCVFCGTSNDLNFLPFDRTGNRRFAPVRVFPEKAENTIYENETESRAYIIQAWAEAMEIYRSGNYPLTFSPEMEDHVKLLQREFMPEDTQTGMIQAFLDSYEEDYICSTIIYQQVFHQEGIVPKWQSKEIGDLMDNEIIGWTKHGNHRFGGAIGTQRSWKRIQPKKDEEGFMKVDENMELPFD